MVSATRRPSARERNFILYGLSLTGEVSASGWSMRVDKARLVDALRWDRRQRRDPSTTFGAPLPRPVDDCSACAVLSVCERGLSVRTGQSRSELPGPGFWASPIAVDRARLRSLAASLPGPEVHLEYSAGRLRADWKSIRAREL